MTLETEKARISSMPVLPIVISWVVYLPVAFSILILTPMAFDSGKVPLSTFWFVGLVNACPLISMMVMTFVAIKKKSKAVAVMTAPVTALSLFLVFCIFFAFNFLMELFQLTVEPIPTKTHFVCSKDLYVDLFDDHIALKQKSYIEETPFTIKNGQILKNEQELYGWTRFKPLYEKALKECKNSEGKTILDIYSYDVLAK